MPREARVGIFRGLVVRMVDHKTRSKNIMVIVVVFYIDGRICTSFSVRTTRIPKSVMLESSPGQSRQKKPKK